MADALAALRALKSFRPGVAYVLDALYLAPTARSPAAHTMRSCRGGAFAAPKAGLAPLPASRASQKLANDTGFEPLPPGAPEPTGAELAQLAADFCAATGNDRVVFQGNGDPLAAADVVLDTVRGTAAKRSGVAFRLNTLGLVDDATAARLFEAFDDESATKIDVLSVFLPAADAATYTSLLAPNAGESAFAAACAFVEGAAATNARVEVTAVDRPDVSVADVEALASRLGADAFRTRSWLG